MNYSIFTLLCQAQSIILASCLTVSEKGVMSQSIYKHRPITYSQRKGPFRLIWAVSQLIVSYSDFPKMTKTLAFSRMLKCFPVKKNTFAPFLSLMNHQNQPSRGRIWAAHAHGSTASSEAEISIPPMFLLGFGLLYGVVVEIINLSQLKKSSCQQ